MKIKHKIGIPALILIILPLSLIYPKQYTIAVTYTYPEPKNAFWNAVTSIGAEKIPYTLINPASGPGKKTDSNYSAQIKKNHNAGIKNIAYVATTYQKKKITKIKTEIEKYFELYGIENINGFFFDEVSASTQENAKYMKEIYTFVKQKSEKLIVIANPGNPITDIIAEYADIWVTSEVSAAQYIEKYEIPTSEFEKNPKNKYKIWHIIHSTKTNEYTKIIELSKLRNAGYLYITDDIMPNPYNKIPSDFENCTKIISK